ncbi:hypothetical protein AJ79_00643 [Helicocarpus griseus UAMH5409]|uniref:Uncharacterized protein n=1 Tax=Helicocarpus griseus UAMH5409 TaxID=1447875 RepID=A0A2B7Y2J5_9EURO|nr:hypothetical protein AJ79_00643 [Helicocarpus griseus UAMH5409]
MLLYQFVLPLLSATVLTVTQYCSGAYAASFTNPLKPSDGSDPFIAYTGGYYYLTTTTWTDIQITRATTLEGLKTGEVKTVWSDTTASRCCNVWAPEIHYFDGTWYLYYTAGSNENLDLQRPHVLRGGPTPWDPYTYAGQLSDVWGIDGTVLRFPERNYFVWSCMTSVGQSLCIAVLDTPTTISGATHTLSEPTEPWEQDGTPVQEGAAAMYHGGKTYIAFSASYCWTPSYQLGLLTWNGGDPLDRGSWVKTGPHFSSANGNYGTGHNGFFLSPDESEIWNVYHATANSEGACDGSRYTMAQVVNWNADGTPDFGISPPFSTVLEGPSGE